MKRYKYLITYKNSTGNTLTYIKV